MLDTDSVRDAAAMTAEAPADRFGRRRLGLLLAVPALIALVVAGRHSYLLFHCLVEIFSVVVAFSIFSLTWNARSFLKNNALVFLGIAYLFVGGLDMVHTLAYRGMNIFRVAPDQEVNLPTQIWIAARGLQAAALLAAPLLIKPRLRPWLALAAGAALTVGALALIFDGRFPTCFVDGAGLTRFKKDAEYAICAVLAGSLALFVSRRGSFEKDVFRLLVASVAVTAVAELTFTLYAGPDDAWNMVGHILKVIAFYLVYRALIETGLMRPYRLLFREIRQESDELREAKSRAQWLARFPEENPSPVLRVAADGAVLYANPAAAASAPAGWGCRTGQPLPAPFRPLLAEAMAGRRSVYGDLELAGRYHAVSLAPFPEEGYANFYGHDVTERRLAEEALRHSEARYRSTLDNMQEGCQLIDRQWRYLFVNRAAAAHGRSTVEELTGRTMMERFPGIENTGMFARLRACMELREPEFIENAFAYPDGSTGWFALSIQPVPEGIFVLSIDITERKRLEENRRLTAEVLHVLNEAGEVSSQIGRVLDAIKRSAGYDAVGLRLKSGDDFPYYLHDGFSEEFVREENFLCPRGADGHAARDADGRPAAECTCGLVLSGRCDPANPLFTEGGSFWTNESSRLLGLKPEEDPRTNPRNRCIAVGYESIALIPLKAGGEIIGLLQLNDRRRGRFDPETVRFFEGLSYNITIALSRRRAEEELRRSHRRSDLLAMTAGELLKTDNPQALVESLCREVMELLDCQAFFNFLADEDAGRLRLNACAGIPAEEARRIEWLDYGAAVCGCVARDGRRIVAEDVQASTDPRTELIKSYGIRAYACHPLTARNRVLGTLSFGTRSRTRFDDEDLSLMKAVADLVSIAMQRKQTEQALEQHRESLEDLVRERTRELTAKTEQLQQAQKMEAIGRLAGGVAHDFNNLMQVVAGYARRTIRELSGGDPRRANIEEVLNASERATGLTRQLLAFSRRQILQPAVLDLNAVVENMLKMLGRLLGEDVEVRTELAPELPRIVADRVQVEQVIMNLAVNSRDAMPSGGRLTVRTSAEALGAEEAREGRRVAPGSYVVLAVSDTGCGMTEEVRSHIFEPFFTTKEAGTGTGLGLATVYGVVQQSGGEVLVDSEPGKGTTFRVYFPVAEGEAAKPASSEPVEAGMPRGTETVLLVEDEPSLRSLVAMELRDLGYKVIEASNIGEALSAAEGHADEVRLVLTDVVLPGVSGPRLSEMLTQRLSGARVLFMSGHTEKHIVHQGMLKPGTAFIAKPFTTEALAEKVREVLDAKG